MSQEKRQRLHQTIAAIRRRWGADALRTLGRGQRTLPPIPTGHTALDEMLDGGIPRGRLTHLLGAPTSGKTALALQIIAHAQREGDSVIYLDPGRRLALDSIVPAGVDLERLALVYPPSLAVAGEILRDAVAARIAGVIVLDVDAAGSQDRPAASTLCQIARLLPATLCAVLVLAPPGHPASEAIAPFADVRLQVEWQTWLHDQRDIQGYQTRVTLLKQRSGPPGQAVSLTIWLPDASGKVAS